MEREGGRTGGTERREGGTREERISRGGEKEQRERRGRGGEGEGEGRKV